MGFVGEADMYKRLRRKVKVKLLNETRSSRLLSLDWSLQKHPVYNHHVSALHSTFVIPLRHTIVHSTLVLSLPVRRTSSIPISPMFYHSLPTDRLTDPL